MHSFQWTAVVLTCQRKKDALACRKELDKRRFNGVLAKETLLLVVEDPRKNVGSGSATLNALLVTAEHLSAKMGFTVVTMEAFQNAHILIVHMGRDFVLDSCKRTFMTVPLESVGSGMSNVCTNLDLLISIVTEKIAHESPPGLWVCSTDMILDVPEAVKMDYSKSAVVVPTVWVDLNYARSHGVLKLSDEGVVSDIIYQGNDEALKMCVGINGLLPVVSGVVYCNLAVIERLLAFTVLSPLDSCTYMGVDSGSVPVQLSLYFDFLLAMCTEVSRDDFENGIRADRYAARFLSQLSENDRQLAKSCRSLIWRELRGLRISSAILENAKHVYIDAMGFKLNELLSHAASTCKSSSLFSSIPLCHALVEDGASLGSTSHVINSIVAKTVSVGNNTNISHSHLIGPAIIGDGTILKGLSANLFVLDDLLQINPGIVMQQIRICNPRDEGDMVSKVLVIFGVHDNVNTCHINSDASFCNAAWEDFYQRTLVLKEDLWDKTIPSNCCTLANARLFPVYFSNESFSLNEISWLQSGSPSREQLEKWKYSKRLSLLEIFSHVDLSDEFAWQCELYHEISCRIVSDTIVNQRGIKLTGYYEKAVIDQKYAKYFDCLDNVAKSCHSPGVSARALANIADVLGSLAQGEGGLRSGPSSNPFWIAAFNLLEKEQIAEGVTLLAKERALWLNSPDRLVRAARHYERAAQILIRQAVLTASQFVSNEYTTSVLPEMNHWVIAQCPARIDISGGWSDTPPITYEHGGAVTNAAILLDGQRPIGAKIKRIPELEIRLVVGEDGCQVKVTDLQHLADYSQPSAPGALLKTALVYSQIVHFPSSESLQTQLQTKYGGGFELHTWSNLPQGSGLGTSSILAGAILACLWKITGHVSDVDSLLHGVLIAEQMLTTGGGWQDQVGGLLGGIKVGHSKASLPLRVDVTYLTLSDEFINKFSDHLILVYTGRTRLARNLLQNVIRNWYARDPEIVQTEDDLVSNAWLCADAFNKGDLALIGQCMNNYWEQKKHMAPGCEPVMVSEMMSVLRPHVYGLSMAGAGGGGFLYVLTKQPKAKIHIEQLLHNFMTKENITIHEAKIDTVGALVTVE